jgi:4-hydroxybenzoate polyprenyltransferase
MAAKGFTAAQWLVIAFIALLAAVIVWEAGHDLARDRQIMRDIRLEQDR